MYYLIFKQNGNRIPTACFPNWKAVVKYAEPFSKKDHKIYGNGESEIWIEWWGKPQMVKCENEIHMFCLDRNKFCPFINEMQKIKCRYFVKNA